MTKKRIAVGCFFAALFLPVFIAGVLFDFIQRYFISGMDVGEEIFERIDEKLGE